MTWSFSGNEAAVAAIVARLNANLAAAVASVNSGVTDGFTIAAPLAVLDYVPALETISNFPTVGIENGDGTFQDDTGYEATGSYEFLIVVVDYDSEQQALTRKMRRHVKALVNALLGSDRAIPPLWGVTVQRIAYGPSLGEIRENAEKPHAFLSWAGIRIVGKQDEV